MSFAWQVTGVTGSELDKSPEFHFNTSHWLFHPGELSGEQLRLTNTEGWDTVSNTSFAESNAPARWQGIGYVKKRLELLYPDRHELKVLPEENLFVVSLKLELRNTDTLNKNEQVR